MMCFFDSCSSFCFRLLQKYESERRKVGEESERREPKSVKERIECVKEEAGDNENIT